MRILLKSEKIYITYKQIYNKYIHTYKIKRITRPNNLIKLYAYNATHLKSNVTASRRLTKRIIVWSI